MNFFILINWHFLCAFPVCKKHFRVQILKTISQMALLFLFEALKMTGRPLKQPVYFFKRNSWKRGLSFLSLLFSMVVLFSIAYNVYQLAPSQKRKSSFYFKILRNQSLYTIFVVVLISNSTVVHGVIFRDSLFPGFYSQFRKWFTKQIDYNNFLFITTFISFLLKDPIRTFLNRQNQQSQEQ